MRACRIIYTRTRTRRLGRVEVGIASRHCYFRQHVVLFVALFSGLLVTCACAEEFARAALLDGAAEGRGGAGGGGMAGTSKLLSENKDLLHDNIEKLGQMSDQTEQMANDAMVRKHLCA